MKKTAIGLACLLMSHFASASTFDEREVESFAQSQPGGHTATLRVLLTFRSNPVARPLAAQRLRVENLQQQNLKSLNLFKRQVLFAQQINLEPMWAINGAFAELTRAQIDQLKTSPLIQGIYSSHRPYKLKPITNKSSPLFVDLTYGLKKIGVLELRQTYPNLTGKGIRVGIIDTGITPDHADLKGRLKVFQNFSPATEKGPSDRFGHGTHVAGTIAGGSASGVAIGVAPEADLFVARIFDGNGNSEREMILKAMQWMMDPDENPATDDFAQVVNNSWSDDEPFNDRNPQDEPFCSIISNWVKVGIVPVFSAGNTGPSAGTINIPGGCPEAFTVGATEQNDRSPHFSSTCPAVWKDMSIMKPEISAPGFKINSAANDGGYEEMSGTSMSAPHATGAFAVLLQAYPQASAETIMNAMRTGSKDLGKKGQDALFGFGRIDIMKSLEVLKSQPAP